MPDDPVTPGSPLGDPGLITPASSTSQGEAATPQTAVAPDTRPAVRVLYVQATGEDKFASYINWYLSYNFGGVSGDVVHVQAFSVDEFKKVLQRYSSIEYLFILTHSLGPWVKFGDHLVNVSTVEQELAKAGNIPKVKTQIAIEGCIAGYGPVELLNFAKFFRVPRLTAYTYYLGISAVSFPEGPEFTSQTDAIAKLAAALSPWEVYFLPGTPTASALAAAAAPSLLAPGLQTYSIPAEWFLLEYTDGNPPVDTTGDREATFRPRSSATNKLVSTELQAQDLATELWVSSGSSHVPPFYRVVIEPVY